MKKILIMLLLLATPCWAINWVDVKSLTGRTGAVDVDSIREYKGYYFYNIKFENKGPSDVVVITMQSGISNPFSARIRAYSPSEYESLKGDYDNIANNMTQDLEFVTYESLAFACYKKVKQIKAEQQAKATVQF